MEPALQDALAAIDRAVEWVRRRHEEGWPPLSAEYLALIEAVELLPENAPGADKTARMKSGAGVRHLADRATHLHPKP
jgi:hypothetical protein